MNAIDRLREEVEAPKYLQSDAARWQSAADALAAVDNLYREAKDLLQVMHDERWDILVANGEVMRDSLAAAARRVEAGT